MFKPVFSAMSLAIVFFLGTAIGWLAHQSTISSSQALKPNATALTKFQALTQDTATAPHHNAPNDQQNDNAQNDLDTLLVPLLAQHKFDQVISIYESLQQDNEPQQQEQASTLILNSAKQLISQQHYALAKALLKRFLNASNRHVIARLMLAETHNRLTHYPAAIDTLYLAKGHAFRLEDIDTINQKIRLIVDKQAHLLKQNSQFRELRLMYEKLTQQEAQYAPYFIGLAEAHDRMGEFEGAKIALETVLDDPNVGTQASALLAELIDKQPKPPSPSVDSTEAAETTPSVALIKQGNHYLLDAHPNSGEAIRLLIDTGASLTTMTLAALQKHNVRYRDTGDVRRFSTANGVITAPVYQLDHLTIGQWRVDDINIAVLDLQGNGGTEGLLGMNFLQHFRFFIDQENSLLHLSLRQ